MKKSEAGKVPIMKIKSENLEKIANAIYEGKPVKVEVYKPKEQKEEDE